MKRIAVLALLGILALTGCVGDPMDLYSKSAPTMTNIDAPIVDLAMPIAYLLGAVGVALFMGGIITIIAYLTEKSSREKYEAPADPKHCTGENERVPRSTILPVKEESK